MVVNNNELDFGAIETEGGGCTPDKRLWCAVLEQVIKDALLLKSDERYKRNWAKTAIIWVMLGTRDFEMVCLSAGYTKHFVRDRFFKWLLSQYTERDLETVKGIAEFRPKKKEAKNGFIYSRRK